ncbi:uncharacterized protein V1513DRAFT_427364 [Lipomyces chichibuensis]|uniref:uncharacterized protein n=1 Tax=Lipomyces chichibuensis TaxID=1546026 RepID=UPI0033440B5B
MSAAVANQLQHTIVDFREYRANGEDMVTSVLAAVGPGSSYVSCQSEHDERFFGEVDRLFSCQWGGTKHQLALVKVFQDVHYVNDKDGLCGRVQQLSSRESYLACINVADI